MVQWGSNEEPYLKIPQRSQSFILIRSLLQQIVALISTRTGGVSATTAFGNRNQTSPHNRLLPSSLALALNASRKFFVARYQRLDLISTYTLKRCKDMNACMNACKWIMCNKNQLLRLSMKSLFREALFRTSSSYVAQSKSNSVPNDSVKITREHSGQPAGSPNEPYIEIQKHQDAIFSI